MQGFVTPQRTAPTTPTALPMPDQSVFESQSFSERKKQKRPPAPYSLPSMKTCDFTPFQAADASHSFHHGYSHHKTIGTGYSGTVFSVKSKEGIFAVKKRRQYKGARDRNEALREFEIGRKITKHPHTLTYYDAWEEEGTLHIKTELCAESLNDLLDRNSGHKVIISEDAMWNYVLDITLGLKHIHECGYIHMDIKPENILVKEGRVKIGDFGSAISSTRMDTDIEEGDSRYVAPEVINDPSSVSFASDIFSFGITIYEMMLNSVELPTSGTLWQKLRSNQIDFSPQTMSGRRVSGGGRTEDTYSHDLKDVILSHPTVMQTLYKRMYVRSPNDPSPMSQFHKQTNDQESFDELLGVPGNRRDRANSSEDILFRR
ncbi:membrane-associated tyrosine- and threonine-specific cdc2-inhibitory kinase-like [Planoprotostelium fungivorum]|uniref:Membrane-associated tyrosine-and threonine-specific cdc2-inhibitory kinase-like n=1 Tax=Planoprotostelium fungivorum TaxID=1890364 RepID=A0A2P6P0J0_9EUKA|nr:membrane-associated tyrosine- and threonine-specific cdc2-inhibitory kinase-like [Planoprotostelium fungivorum]